MIRAAWSVATSMVVLLGCIEGEPTFEELPGGGTHDELFDRARWLDADRSASASYWMPSGDGVCPAHCLKMQASCTTEPLSAGVYTVEYAGETTGFTVPSIGEAAQLGTVQRFTHECGL